ncbi:zinc finger protein 503 [Ciona intestinalis]
MTNRSLQYLRSEYIQPPPGSPTVDAKQSPLALLAQTCSAIGKDAKLGTKIFTTDPKKSPPAGKVVVTSSRTSPAMASSPKQVPSPHLPYNQQPVKREKSPANHSSPPAKKARVSTDSSKSNYVITRDVTKVDDAKPIHSPQMEKYRHQQSSKRRHTTSRSSHDDDTKKQDTSSTKSPHTHSPYSRGITSNCVCPTSATDPRNVTGTSPQSFDPYCMGCRGPHITGNPCFDLKSPSLPFYPFTTPGYPLYAQMVMAAAARTGPTIDPAPHVCNWVNSGSGNCGKRFTTADELFTHLRTHALSSSAPTGYLMGGLDKLTTNPYAAYLSQHAAALAAATSPTPAFLSRPHSPLNRYNPYKTPTLSPQLPAMPPLPIAAGVGPYCSPFALYGQRLGAFPYN